MCLTASMAVCAEPVSQGASPAAESGADRPPAVSRTAKEFSEADVQAAVKEAISSRSKDGSVRFHDPHLNAELNLVFEQIRIVRGMQGYGWFPNVIFHDRDAPAKKYAIDFWFKPQGDKLELVDIRIQKGPKQDGDNWIMVTRLPVAWWWLPVSEHPGDMEVTRAWQVMAAIHKHIADTRKNGVYQLKDDKTGNTIPLEFVEIHQPVRRLKEDGRYFACTDFRKVGSKDEYYDIDFWLDGKSGSMSVRSVRIHKVPAQEDGLWTQVPRYNFDGLNFEVVQ